MEVAFGAQSWTLPAIPSCFHLIACPKPLQETLFDKNEFIPFCNETWQWEIAHLWVGDIIYYQLKWLTSYIASYWFLQAPLAWHVCLLHWMSHMPPITGPRRKNLYGSKLSWVSDDVLTWYVAELLENIPSIRKFQIALEVWPYLLSFESVFSETFQWPEEKWRPVWPHPLRYPRAGHNDLRLLGKKDYFREVQMLCERVVSGTPQVWSSEQDLGRFRFFREWRNLEVTSLNDPQIDM